MQYEIPMRVTGPVARRVLVCCTKVVNAINALGIGLSKSGLNQHGIVDSWENHFWQIEERPLKNSCIRLATGRHFRRGCMGHVTRTLRQIPLRVERWRDRERKDGRWMNSLVSLTTGLLGHRF
jgi:hypothetical protein